MSRVRVSAYVDSPAQSQLAQDVLSAVDPSQMTVYDGLVDGVADESALRELQAHGLLVDTSAATAPEVAFAAAASPPEVFEARATRSLDLEPLGRRELELGADEIEPAPSDERAVPYQVRLKQPTSTEIRRELQVHGIDICGFVPPLGYSMFLTPTQVQFLQSRLWVDSIARQEAGGKVRADVYWKIARATMRGLAADEDVGVEASQFDVLLKRPEDLENIRAMLADVPGIEVVDASNRLIRVKAPGNFGLLDQLDDRPEVERVVPYQAPTLFADVSRELIGIDLVSAVPGDWDGTGQVVGIFDSGIDADHPDFADRIQHQDKVPGAVEEDQIGHGSHVAGIVAGTGAASGGRIRGMAPGAKLVVFSIAGADNTLQLGVDLGKLLQLALDQGARVINLSWGTAINGEYNFGSLSVDQFVYDHPNVLVVVAAGNDGKMVNGDLSFRDVGTPATARNVLTVGACQSSRNGFATTWGQFRPAKFAAPPFADVTVTGDAEQVAPISSRGPTDYDSVKPDVLAPGTCIASIRSGKAPQPNPLYWNTFDLAADPRYAGVPNLDQYVFLGGTSMAAPVVSGAAAVLRQYLVAERLMSEPSAALMKALLVISTRRVHATQRGHAPQIGFPDFDQGFGRVALGDILPHEQAPAARRLAFVDVANDSAEALESRAPIGGPRKSFRTYLVSVTDSEQPLRVVLAWTDYPGNSLQNNLQLDVRGPGGLALVGNQELRYLADPLFVPSANQSNPFDKRNNVELVELVHPPPGDYRIRVVAQNTPFPNQGYALGVVGSLASETLALAPTF